MTTAKFYPKKSSFTREQIARVLSIIVTEGENEKFIKATDPKLTDKLCQYIVNRWYSFEEGSVSMGLLWDDEDTFTPRYEKKFKKLFPYKK